MRSSQPSCPPQLGSSSSTRIAAVRLTVLVMALILNAGCSNSIDPTVSASTAPPEPPIRTQTTPTPDPLESFSTAERAFISAFKEAGYGYTSSDSTDNAATVQIGNYICTDIKSGTRPAQTKAALLAKNLPSPADAEKIYNLAHTTICPGDPLPNPDSFSDGTYQVGVDIQPGTYRSPGGQNCYWARLAKNQTDIVDNDLSSGPTIFTVKASDGFVKLHNCTWTKSS